MGRREDVQFQLAVREAVNRPHQCAFQQADIHCPKRAVMAVVDRMKGIKLDVGWIAQASD